MIISPIKIQGKKTKIIPNILQIVPNENNLWIEPFLGSGEVLFNVNPQFALVADNNKYIINFYKALQSNQINAKIVREYLEFHGSMLEKEGKDYYYKIRDDFNKTGNVLEFLFLNRSCFNGVMRFNNKGEFNVPFCNKNNRFSKALITKITNQVNEVQKILLSHQNNWKFVCCDWKDIEKFNDLQSLNKIYYYDPPYVERHSTYFDAWTNDKNSELFSQIASSNNKIILSNWLKNDYRVNEHISTYFSNSKFIIYEIQHYYHVGGKKNNRNPIIECLVHNLKKKDT